MNKSVTIADGSGPSCFIPRCFDGLHTSPVPAVDAVSFEYADEEKGDTGKGL